MSQRKIITIDEALCTGCGNCETGCAEGALRVVNGKARLVKEQFCDGLTAIVRGAARLSGRCDLELVEVTIGLHGDVVAEARLT
jgi:MinD superfamily P-loop ATPase